MSSGLLEARQLERRFGALRAVDGVSLTVEAGTITGLIGPNGAGKSTLFALLAGELKPHSGEVRFAGERIEGAMPDRIFRAGLARTFQIPRPFPQMTVLENVMLAPIGQAGERFWNNWVRPGAVRAEERRHRERAHEVLDFTGLGGKAQELAGQLSGGQQKLLELARVMMVEPKLILLDEPAAGVNPALLQLLIEKILALHARGMTFLIIEHNMDMVMRICRPIIVMAQGRVIFEGDPDGRARRSAACSTPIWGMSPRERRRRPLRPQRRRRIRARAPGRARRLGGCRERRDRHDHRPERRRQIHLPQGAGGADRVRRRNCRYDGRDVSGLPAHEMVRVGIGFVPQTGNIFTSLSINENLMVGGHVLPKRELKARVARAYAQFPALAGRRSTPARVLSGGERQMLAVGRALMTDPKLIMLDEPTAGLAPKIVGEVFDGLRKLAESGVAVLMVEQNAKAALRVSDRGYVLVEGRNRLQGAAADLLADPAVGHAFLGAAAEEPPGAARLQLVAKG